MATLTLKTSDLSKIHKIVNGGQYCFIGDDSQFYGIPLKRNGAPSIHIDSERSFPGLDTEEDERYLLFIDKLQQGFTVTIQDDKGKAVFKRGPSPTITIHQAMDDEAERVEKAADNAFELLECLFV